MVDFIDKKTEIKRYFPSPAYKLKEGKGLSLILDIIGDQLNILNDEAANARDQFLLATAQGYYLREIGKDLDVFKPKGFKMRDQVYRQLIEIITNSSKNIEYSFERMMKLFFGNNIFISNLASIYSYEKNLICIDIKENALIVASSRDLYGTTYMHRDTSGHFDGFGTPSWTSNLSYELPSGSMNLTLDSLPSGIPDSGIVEIGTYGELDYETKQFTLVGNTLVFIGPTYYRHSIGSGLRGPQTPDDYPSGYVFNTVVSSALSDSYSIGAPSILLGAGYEDFPLVGTCYIGTPAATNFETIGFVRSGNVLDLYGVTVNGHSAGEPVIIPCFYRKYRAVIQEDITHGTSESTITVDNGADFPAAPFEGAIVFNRSFVNEEIVPFKGRSLGDNTQMLISPNYQFINDHEAGETVHLMSLKSSVDRTGIDFAFYLNDTEGLRQQLFALLTRIKVVGCKIVFTVY
jgi:hypothetical protein